MVNERHYANMIRCTSQDMEKWHDDNINDDDVNNDYDPYNDVEYNNDFLIDNDYDENGKHYISW